MNLAQKYMLDKDRVVYRIIGNEAVILETRTGYSYSINEAGTDIWKALDEELNLNQILQCLAEKYSMSEERAKNDLEQFLEILTKEGLIKKSDISKLAEDKRIGTKKEKKKKYEAPKLEKYYEIKRGRSVA